MAGGQKGLSFVGEPMMFAVAATFLITVLVLAQFGLLSCSGGQDPSAMDRYDEACLQEYADANDGDDDTKVETAILEQPDCRAAVAAMKAERQAKQMEQVQEAQQP
jgi:hypothetical protein